MRRPDVRETRNDERIDRRLVAPVARRFLAGRPLVAVVFGAWQLLATLFRSILLTITRAWIGLFPRARPRRVRSAVRSLPEEPTILFCCPGNRGRSAVAERFARAELERRSIDDVEVESGSLVPVVDEETPAVASAAARRFSVDVSNHEPVAVTGEQLRRCDLVLVMDGADYLRLAVSGTTAIWNTYVLGTMAEDASTVEITSARGQGGERAYWRTYATVAESVDRLVDCLEDSGFGREPTTVEEASVLSSPRERGTVPR